MRAIAMLIGCAMVAVGFVEPAPGVFWAGGALTIGSGFLLIRRWL